MKDDNYDAVNRLDHFLITEQYNLIQQALQMIIGKELAIFNFTF